MFYQKKLSIVHGYYYCGIKYGDKIITKRVHRLVAEAFIPNPNNYNVVGHKNNIKNDNRVENLYWTTVQENTKKAYNDGLAKNDKGYNDSQSMPVYVCDLDWNIIKEYGSCRECAKDIKVSVSTILRQARKQNPHKPKGIYRFCFQEDYETRKHIKDIEGKKIYSYNLDTKEVICWPSIHKCSIALNISKTMINLYLQGRKPQKYIRKRYLFSYKNDF